MMTWVLVLGGVVVVGVLLLAYSLAAMAGAQAPELYADEQDWDWPRTRPYNRGETE